MDLDITVSCQDYSSSAPLLTYSLLSCPPTKEDSTMYGVRFPIARIAANTLADSRELVRE